MKTLNHSERDVGLCRNRAKFMATCFVDSKGDIRTSKSNILNGGNDSTKY